jgi:hypothetical protein
VDLELTTLNNLACVSRQRGDVQGALATLEGALRACGGAEVVSRRQLCVTHSNVCAVLSEMGRHVEAAEHARRAVGLCEEGGEAEEGGQFRGNRVALAIACYNLAVRTCVCVCVCVRVLVRGSGWVLGP